MHIVLAFDKFKGTLTAIEACEATERGMARVLPEATFSHCPIADGGDGTVAALAATSAGKMIQVAVENAVHTRKAPASFWLDEEGVATMEMASASGLAMLPEDERDPSRATTFGTGKLMQAATKAGATKLVLGLGGSATNDGGMGMARAFGYQFLDAAGEAIGFPGDLEKLDRIVAPEDDLPPTCLVLVDVAAPLLGTEGATHIFGPQKGVTTELAPKLEAGLTQLADIAARDLSNDFRDIPGAGAAGGLGFGLLAFCHATLVPGFDYICQRIGLERAIAKADWVVTGEGGMDLQTLTGKGPHGVAKLAHALGKPIAALAGSVPQEERPQLAKAFPLLHALTDYGTIDEAMTNPKPILEQAAQELAKQIVS